MSIFSVKSFYRFLHPKFQNLFSEYKVEFKPRWGHGKAGHPELLNLIDQHRSEYALLLEEALTYKEKFWEIKSCSESKDELDPCWNNGFLPGLDIVGIYTMLAHYKPKKYIEIGSGNSTKVAYKAKKENSLNTKIISIDPEPRAQIDQLADEIIRQPFENINLDLTEELEPGDILFVDNSHRILPNSDAMVFFLEVLPKLKKGVIVHIHDIYLPYDYPQFMCDRFYSEQYGLAMFLLANPVKYKTLLPNYFISQDPELSKVIAPMWDHSNLSGIEHHGGSYWLEIAE
jgi:hypothetical protein